MNATSYLRAYGQRLSGAEYDRRLVDIYEGSDPQNQQARRAFELAVDHRLGIDFPKAKREALWTALEEAKKAPLLWVAMTIPLLRRAAYWLMCRRILRGAGKILDRQDLQLYFGDEIDLI